jgi:hypothetical protein
MGVLTVCWFSCLQYVQEYFTIFGLAAPWACCAGFAIPGLQLAWLLFGI